MKRTALALLGTPLSPTFSDSSTTTLSAHFRGYATTLRDLGNSRAALVDSFGRLELLLPPPTGPSSTEPQKPSKGHLNSLDGS